MGRIHKIIVTKDSDCWLRNRCNEFRYKLVQASWVVMVLCTVSLTGFAQLGSTKLGKLSVKLIGAHYCHDTQK